MSGKIFFTKNTNSDKPVRTPLLSPHLEQYLMVVRDLESGFESVQDHVVITDPDAHIIYANKAAEKNTGFSREEMIGKNPGDLWGGEMPKEFYEKMWETIKIERRPFVGEVKNRRKDGTEYWQELHISPILWDNGDVKFFIGIEPNITDRKEKERFREEFISILAHQLKNPMASFRWTLDWLSAQRNLTKDQREMIAGLYKNNESLINLVGDMLVLARIGATDKFIKEEIDIGKAIECIIGDAKTTHPRVSISFEREGTFVVFSYPSLIIHIFTNIIFNAAEYSDKEQGVVDISLARHQGGYIFTCKDNGIGIPPEEQAKIFSKFFRASNAIGQKERGTGLGLFIVKMIADNLGWKIRFASKPSAGTVFMVEIPS